MGGTLRNAVFHLFLSGEIMNKISFFLFILFSFLFCQDLQWTRTYNNGITPYGWDIGSKVFETDDDGFLVIGTTQWNEIVDSLYRYYRQFFIIKTDEFGNVITKRMYCDSVWITWGVTQFSGDTFISFGGDRYSVYNILAVNSEGDSVFSARVTDILDTWGWPDCLSKTNDGCLIYANGRPPELGSAIILYKLGLDGEILWTRECHIYDSFTIPTFISQTLDSGFIVGGGTEDYQGWVFKINSDGDSLWCVHPPCLSIYSIVETAPNEFLCLGQSGYCWIFLCKIIGDGDVLWAQHWMYDYSDTSYVQTYSLIPTFDRNFVFCGQTGGYIWTGNLADAYLVKIDSLGNPIWKRRVDIAGRPDLFYSVIQTRDSGYVCTGYASASIEETLEVCLVKFSKDGDLVWENGIKIPQRPSISIYPNPFNSSCIITVSVGDACMRPEKIEIFDLRGNVVYIPPHTSGSFLPEEKGELISAQAQSLSPWGVPTGRDRERGSIVWQPGKSIPSGIYLIKATMDNGQTNVKRVVYLK